MSKRVGGIIFVKANGRQFDAKGAFEYNLGRPKRDPVIGHDGHHGFKEVPQEAYISGEITDSGTMDLAQDLLNITDATVTIELANGKVIVLAGAYYSGTGTGITEEGNVEVRFTGAQATEIR